MTEKEGFVKPRCCCYEIDFAFRSQSSGLRPKSEGFSHGLKKYPLDTFLPSLWSGRPFKSLVTYKTRPYPKG